MPVVLLVLGGVTTVAGLVLIASGLAIRDGSFDTEVLTPGTIAVVGGLLLVGLGFVVRELRRIERALAARPMPGVARAEQTALMEATEPAAAAEPAEPMPPPLPKIEPQVAAAPPAPLEAPVEDTALQPMRAKFPAIPRVENGRFTEASDVSLALREAAGVGEGVAEMRSVASAGRAANGLAASARIVPRADVRASQVPPSSKAKVSMFNTFWPAPPGRDGQTPAQVAAPTPLPAVQEPELPPAPAQAPPAPPRAPAAAPVSVLKSGVVEGMAYTLYSDGSIEAQLPQGTLRFGSIGALRSHIENSA
jgi:hypothetical protein